MEKPGTFQRTAVREDRKTERPVFRSLPGATAPQTYLSSVFSKKLSPPWHRTNLNEGMVLENQGLENTANSPN
jgi:hypothetical protein